MSVTLTEGAIISMCRDDFSSEGMQPVLQVIELKLLQQSQLNSAERYKIVLSDGSHYQQGMLATQKNALAKSGILQKGSIVKITQYICSLVQNRQIIIITDLDVVLEKYERIGDPQPVSKIVPAQSSTVQSGTNTGNPQSLSSRTLVNSMPARPNVTGSSLDHQKMNYPANSAYVIGPDSSRHSVSNVLPTFPKAEPGVTIPKSMPFNGSYGDQNIGFRGAQSEGVRPLQNSLPRPPQPMYRQPYANRGPNAKNEAPPRIIPITALNPYQSMWTIKARVTAKGEIRHYSNAKGEGKVFSFDLLDSDGGEIRATCFNTMVDHFYNLIEYGKVYLISKGSIKPAQKNFNHLRNDQELTLDMTTVIQPCIDDDNSIPKQSFNFRSISEIESMENNSIVDVIGVVSAISQTASIMRKNGTETQKRVLQLRDMSGRSVELTLWGNFCNTDGQRLQSICDSGAFPILVVKAARVNDFNGKSVGTIGTSQLFVDPDVSEAYTLRQWFGREGQNIPSVSISREFSNVGKTDIRKTVSQIKDEKLGTSEKPDWITVCASVVYIKVDNFCYTACPIMIGDRQCNKKVTNNGDGKWRCDRCDQSVDVCDYRYILQFQIQDHTGLTWVTAFQECGEEIMGMSANVLYSMKYEAQDDEKFAEIIRKVLFTKYIFKLKVMEETFSDEQRVKSTAVKVEKVNFSSESRFILDLIEKLKAEKIEGINPNLIEKLKAEKIEGINPNLIEKLKAEKIEGINPNPVINNAILGNVGSGQTMPTPCNPINSNSNAIRGYGMPANQSSHYGNQFISSFSSAGAPGSYMSCNNCGGSGHSSVHCPNVMSGPGQSTGFPYANRASAGSIGGGGPGDCFKCQQPGHWAKDCPLSGMPGQYGVVQKQRLGGF